MIHWKKITRNYSIKIKGSLDPTIWLAWNLEVVGSNPKTCLFESRSKLTCIYPCLVQPLFHANNVGWDVAKNSVSSAYVHKTDMSTSCILIISFLKIFSVPIISSNRGLWSVKNVVMVPCMSIKLQPGIFFQAKRSHMSPCLTHFFPPVCWSIAMC